MRLSTIVVLAWIGIPLVHGQVINDEYKLQHPKAFEMVVIEGVSSTKRTFVTKTGKRDGYTEGQEVSFNTKNIGIVARAKLVTSLFTVWEVIQPGGTIPFNRDDVVIMNRATENIWELIPKQERKVKTYSNWHVRGTVGLGIHESFSSVEQQDVERNEYSFDALYEYRLGYRLPWGYGHQISLGVGVRLERENQEFEAVQVEVNRAYVMGEFSYHFPRFDAFYDSHLYAGISLGVGYSTSFVDGLEQVGLVYLIPGITLGLEHELTPGSSVTLFLGLESLAIREIVDFVGEQDTNEVNAKAGVGYKLYF